MMFITIRDTDECVFQKRSKSKTVVKKLYSPITIDPQVKEKNIFYRMHCGRKSFQTTSVEEQT